MAQRSTDPRRPAARITPTLDPIVKARILLADSALTIGAREVTEIFFRHFTEKTGVSDVNARLAAAQDATEAALDNDSATKERLRTSIRSGISAAKWALGRATGTPPQSQPSGAHTKRAPLRAV